MSYVFHPSSISRPDPRLMRYYFFMSILSGPAFPFVLLAFYFRYITLRYKFDDEGVSMSYGVLIKREVNLTYRRLQDIHLTHNLLQRWMGLATIGLQTASGNSGAEMSIEGVLEANALRDFLYARMRGARDENHMPGSTSSNAIMTPGVSTSATKTLETLTEIRDALKTLVERGGVQS